MFVVKNMVKWILTSFVISFCLNYSISASSLSELKTHLDFKKLSSEFHQEIFDGKQRLIQSTKGEMHLNKPGRFRWQVNTPFNQVLVVNQEGVWNHDVDLEQVTLYDSNQSMQTSPAALLIGDFDSFEKHYQVEKVQPGENRVRYILKPKTDEAGQWFEWVGIEFFSDTLKKMTIADHLGQNTHIHFSNVKINPRIRQSLFKIKIPKGVDFIDQRQGTGS